MNFSEAFFEGFVSHWKEERTLPFRVVFALFVFVKNRPRTTHEKTMLENIFAIVTWTGSPPSPTPSSGEDISLSLSFSLSFFEHEEEINRFGWIFVCFFFQSFFLFENCSSKIPKNGSRVGEREFGVRRGPSEKSRERRGGGGGGGAKSFGNAARWFVRLFVHVVFS